jgi:hypothetical protein
VNDICAIWIVLIIYQNIFPFYLRFLFFIVQLWSEIGLKAITKKRLDLTVAISEAKWLVEKQFENFRSLGH